MNKEASTGSKKAEPGDSSGSNLTSTSAAATGGSSSYSDGGSNFNTNDGSLIHVRDPQERPIYKLSVKLIDTYKHINKVYYEGKAAKQKLQEQAAGTSGAAGANAATPSSSSGGTTNTRGGTYNDGYDDQHYDYILHTEEIFAERYLLKQRIGKGSFGQVVCAYDQVEKKEVAIKIIKSRRPFMLQAQTEIELLEDLLNKDQQDEHNIVRMIHKFVFRNHQCLVFEMLSYNLYELLKNTRFKGVSLNLIRKFSKQILKSLKFLASPEVDMIHCDLKPENILLRHPRRSAIKLIDFGSSCFSNRRTYTYIQSRFYRSPEILLGLKYDQKIDVWSLGCVLVEMHTGEPLFGGADQVDQMCRIVDVLGMPPYSMIELSPQKNRSNFFEKLDINDPIPTDCDTECKCYAPDNSCYFILKRPSRDAPPPRTLAQIIGVDTGGPFGRRKDEVGHAHENYMEFLLFISKLLHFDPGQRVPPDDAMFDPYILDSVNTASTSDSDAVTNGAPIFGASSETPSTGGTNMHTQEAQLSHTGAAAAEGGGDGSSGLMDTERSGEKRRGRESDTNKPRSRSLSAPASKNAGSGSGSGSGSGDVANGGSAYMNYSAGPPFSGNQQISRAAKTSSHVSPHGTLNTHQENGLPPSQVPMDISQSQSDLAAMHDASMAMASSGAAGAAGAGAQAKETVADPHRYGLGDAKSAYDDADAKK